MLHRVRADAAGSDWDAQQLAHMLVRRRRAIGRGAAPAGAAWASAFAIAAPAACVSPVARASECPALAIRASDVAWGAAAPRGSHHRNERLCVRGRVANRNRRWRHPRLPAENIVVGDVARLRVLQLPILPELFDLSFRNFRVAVSLRDGVESSQ